MIQFPEPARSHQQHHALGLTCEALPVVRMAFVGLGKRGKEAFSNFMYIDGVEVVAVADPVQRNIDEVQHLLRQHKKSAATAYTYPSDWKKICERSDIDLVYICTDRSWHTPIAVHAMQCGKHVAIEVPAANTLEECWLLVDTAEKTRRHCMMLENCCYDAFEMAVLNMAQQGILGEIFHAEGAYIHDLRSLDFSQKPHYLDLWQSLGNPYPTHGLGSLCQLMNIHRGDRMKYLCSVSGGQFGAPTTQGQDFSKFPLGNINTSIIKTERNKTIVLQHDISSPRPYSRNYLISGTEGFVQKRNIPEMVLNSFPDRSVESLLSAYEHPFYAKHGDLARQVGGHGGMDFIMDYRLIYCLQNGLPLDMDVYDAAEWSSMIPLTAASVQHQSQPVAIPDFTRGYWNQLSGIQFA